MVPARFAECPGEYRSPKDDQLNDAKYLECEIGLDQNPCALLKDLHQAKDFRYVFLALLPMLLAIVALAANCLLSGLSLYLLIRPKGGQQHGKKRLALLLSRSTACTFVLLLLLAVLLAWHFGAFKYWSLVMFLTVGIAQFLAMAGTNLALSSLLYAAVLHPLFYRSWVSLGRCWTIIGTIWAIAIGTSVPFGLFGATLFYPETAPIKCSYQPCQWSFSLCLFLLLSSAYLLTIGCHLLMLWKMHARAKGKVEPRQQSKTSSESGSLRRHLRAMNRLTLNLLVFSLCKVPFVLISLIALVHLDRLHQLGRGEKNSCKTFAHGALFFQVELLSSLAAIVWLIGMTVDAGIDLCLDQRFRSLLDHAKSLLILEAKE